MKKNIRYYISLFLLVSLLIPSVAFAASEGQPTSSKNQHFSKATCVKILNVCKKFDTVNFYTGSKFKLAPDKKYVKTKQNEKNVKIVQPEKPAGSGTVDSGKNVAAKGYEAQVADLVNRERAEYGLPALKYNSSLSKVAEAKAADMRDKGYFSHTSPTYGSPFDMMKSFGISYRAAGENIAKGYKTPSAVMNGWMGSEGHKANILNSSFTEIGIGYVTDNNGTAYWVQMFILP